MHAPSGPPGQIVLLNGVSSSGKTSIAEQWLSVLQRPWFHRPVDAINGMRAKHRTLALSPAELDVVLARTRAGFHRAVAGMAAAGNNVVMDHVLSERWRLLDCLTVLADFDVVFVGLRRSARRGHRRPNRAAASAGLAADRRVGPGRGLLGAPLRPAHAAGRDQGRPARPRALGTVRHADASGEGVLHCQGDRLGAPRDLEEKSGLRRRVDRPSPGQDVGGDVPRGGTPAAGDAGRSAPRRAPPDPRIATKQLKQRRQQTQRCALKPQFSAVSVLFQQPRRYISLSAEVTGKLRSVRTAGSWERGLMVRSKKLAGMVLAAGLVAAGLAAGSVSASASASACGGSGSVSTVNGTAAAGEQVTAAWMLAHGYALAGSSYASTGWAIASGLPDQISTLNTFDRSYGQPRTTVAWGHSLGGIITAGLLQDYPSRFDAALPMCGVLSGGVATWNTALDGAFAFATLIDPSIQVTGITNPTANLQNAEAAVAKAQQTAAGRARLALVAALADTPGWFTPLSAEPAATDYAAQEASQYLWFTQVTFPFIFAFRADLEAKAGGNPSWNTGVNYVSDLAKSADVREVKALYRSAGLSLGRDVRTLNGSKRISADPSAVAWLTRNIVFNGDISVPVLTMHTTGDGLVVPENEQAYRAVVDRAGHGALLRQIFVARAGHCAFTPAETITAVQTLENRMSTGRWHVPAPAGLNAEAAALGPTDNIYSLNGTIYPAAPAFTSYTPARYLRPFDLWPWGDPR